MCSTFVCFVPVIFPIGIASECVSKATTCKRVDSASKRIRWTRRSLNSRSAANTSFHGHFCIKLPFDRPKCDRNHIHSLSLASQLSPSLPLSWFGPANLPQKRIRLCHIVVNDIKHNESGERSSSCIRALV